MSANKSHVSGPDAQDEQETDGGLNLIRQMRSSDAIYRKISTVGTNEEVAVIAQGSKFGQEIMTCVWSPDGQFFAWSVGSPIVSVHSVNELLPALAAAGSSAQNVLESWPQYQAADLSQEGYQGKIELDCGQVVTSLAFGVVGGGSAASGRRPSEIKYQRFQTKGNLLLAVGMATGDIKVIDMANGKISLLLQDHTDAVTSLEFSRDGSLILVSASKDRTVNLWDLMDDGNMFRSFKDQSVKDTAWAPDSKHIVTVGAGKIAKVWKLSDFELEKSLQGHQNDVTGCRFSADGKLLYTSSFDTRVICWDVASAQIKRKFEHMTPPPSNIFAAGTNEHEVTGLDLKQSRLATICNDGFVRVWDVTNEKSSEPIARVEISPDARTIALSPDEKVLAIGCQGGFMQFYALD